MTKRIRKQIDGKQYSFPAGTKQKDLVIENAVHGKTHPRQDVPSSSFITIRFTEAEKANIVNHALGLQMTVSDYCRMRLSNDC